jgi:hypothetical protein
MKQTKTLIVAVLVAAFLFSGVTVWSVISNNTDQQFTQAECRAQGDIMPRQFDNSLTVVDNKEENVLLASVGDIPPKSFEEWKKDKENDE